MKPKRSGILAILIVAAVVLTPLSFVGCKTSTGTSTYTVDKAVKVASLLKATARSGVVIAWNKDKNSPPYFKAAAVALSKFVTGTDLSPNSLSAALEQTSIRELKTIEAQLAMNTAVGLYEVFWGDMVRDNVMANEPLRLTIQGLIDGILLGLQDVHDLSTN